MTQSEHKDREGLPTERTSLLRGGSEGGSPGPIPTSNGKQRHYSRGDEEESVDILAQDILSSTPPTAAALAPETLGASAFRARSRSAASRRTRRASSAHSKGYHAVQVTHNPGLGNDSDDAAARKPLLGSGGDGGDCTRDDDDVIAAADKDDDDERALPKANYLIHTNYRQFWIVFMGVMLTNFMTIFDSTIMASSHPVITSYFRSSNSASWLSTSFLLTSTAAQPIVGRLSDSLGRKSPYLVAMTIFSLSTVWCAAARSMTELIVARAVCGLGAGGLVALGSIIVSDLVPIERRSNYQSIININYGVSAAAGASLGGLMADNLGWRWEFGVQVFPMVACFAVAVLCIPRDLGLHNGKPETFVQAMRAFDFLGSALLTVATTFLILGLVSFPTPAPFLNRTLRCHGRDILTIGC